MFATGTVLVLAAITSVLTVRRSDAATDCPDAAALSASIARITTKAPLPQTEADADVDDRFEVSFTRASGRYRVLVRGRGARSGRRSIEDPGTTCATLAEATALTIALLVDPEGTSAAEPAAPPPPPPSTPPPPPAVPAKPKPTTPRVVAPPTGEHPTIAVSAGGGAVLGLVRPAAPMLSAAAEIRLALPLSAEVGAIFVPPQSLALGRGAIDVFLVAAAADACVWPLRKPLRLGACVGTAVGMIRGVAKGFDTDRGATRPWVAATLGARTSGKIAGPLEWYARAGVVAPVHRESFSVDGAGVAYEAWPVGGLVGAGLSAKIW